MLSRSLIRDTAVVSLVALSAVWVFAQTTQHVAATSVIRPPTAAAHQVTDPWGLGTDAAAIPHKFKSVCKYSHRLEADPIVYPDTPVAGHSHEFFGNTTTDGMSTLDSLLVGTTTCSNTDDTAAYWVPTLYYDGAPVKSLLEAYYRDSRKPPYSDQIQAFPTGLKIIAGDSHATIDTPQSTSIVGWACGDTTAVITASIPDSCPGDQPLVMKISFPSCWDGINTDSADHKSHMSYQLKRGVCDMDHPIFVPALQIGVRFKVTGSDLPSHITLSTPSTYGIHADFFNSWQQAGLEERVDTCLRGLIDCNPKL